MANAFVCPAADVVVVVVVVAVASAFVVVVSVVCGCWRCEEPVGPK